MDLLYIIPEHYREFHEVEMQRYNSEYSIDSNYFIGSIPASDVRTVWLQYWILAQDFAGNNKQSPLEYVNVEKRSSVTEVVTKERTLPDHVLEAINSMQDPTPVGMLEVISMSGGNVIKSYQDKIMLKNSGNLTLQSIWLMLSPGLHKSFKLSDTTVESIEPDGNFTLSFELNGNPARDMIGGLLGYQGALIVMAEHHNPIVLPINIGNQESNYLKNYMESVSGLAKQRYNKISLLNDLVSHDTGEQGFRNNDFIWNERDNKVW